MSVADDSVYTNVNDDPPGWQSNQLFPDSPDRQNANSNPDDNVKAGEEETSRDTTRPSTAVSCGKMRCCAEWKSSGWFNLVEGGGGGASSSEQPEQQQQQQERVIDVGASFAPTLWTARLWKVGHTGWLIATLVQIWWNWRTTPAFFLAYLTHWGLILSTVWSIFSLGNSLFPSAAAAAPPQPQMTSDTTTRVVVPNLWIKVCWVLYQIAAEFSCAATILFWTVEFDYSRVPPYLTIMSHGGTFILMCIEGLAINRIPIRWKHVLFVMFAGFLYVLWTIIHQFLSDIGNPRKSDNDQETNDDLIYDVLDYKKSTGFASGLVVGVIFVLLPIIHLTFWLLSLYSFPCGGFNGSNRRYLDSAAAAAQDDEEYPDSSDAGDEEDGGEKAIVY